MVGFMNFPLMLFLWTGFVTTQSSDYSGPQFNCTFQMKASFLREKVDVDVNNQSCSFTPFVFAKSWEGDNRMTLSCAATGKVTLNLTYYAFEGFSLGCSASFPLDVDLDTALPPGSNISYEKTGATFTTTFSHTREASTTEGGISGNFTFLSTRNPSLSTIKNVTIALYLLSRRPQWNIDTSTDPPAINHYYSYGFVSLICRTPSSGLYMSTAFGVDPTHTGLLLKCLLLEGPHCQTAIGVQTYWKDATPDSKKHGAVFCFSGKLKASKSYFSPVNSCDLSDVLDIWDHKKVIRIQRDDLKSHFVVDTLAPLRNSINTVKIFENEFVGFECHFLRYAVGLHPISWITKYQNGSEHAYTSSEETKEEKYCNKRKGNIRRSSIWETSSHIQIQGHAGMIAVECQVNYWNFNGTANATLNVNIKDLSEAEAPTFLKEETELETAVGRPHLLECVAKVADPKPQYSWEFVPSPSASNTNFSVSKLHIQSSIFGNGSWGSTLSLPPFVPSMEGKYICSAKNVRGSATRIFKITLNKDSEHGTSVWLYIGIAVGITAVVGISAISCSRKYFLKQGRLTAMEIMMFEKGDAKQFRSDQYAHENAQFMPYNRGFEIKWNDLKIFDEDKLGEGEYGVVFKGCLIGNTSHAIAVKTVKPGADRTAILALLSELKVMIHLESHENVVKLLGACTEFLKEGRLYVMVEYCPLGSMDSYLRRLDKKQFAEMHLSCNHTKAIEESNLNYESVDYLCAQDMVGWAIQIARGMQHLESKKVIHGDLATRNILMYSKVHVKVTDFGLSRQLMNYDNYVKKSQTKLPWRWLALETLKSLTFSHKSDVWAYGVTLWEIFTLGLIPYPGMNWTTEFVLHLEDNLRLYQPKFATDNMYKIMMRCWDPEPGNRPNFEQLEQALSGLSE